MTDSEGSVQDPLDIRHYALVDDDGGPDAQGSFEPSSRRIYPCTVTPARYGGAYEGASWLAFPTEPWNVPLDASADDNVAREWFEANRSAPIGRGEDVASAYDDLVRQIDVLAIEVGQAADEATNTGEVRLWEFNWDRP